jgi:integrase/recombinase XerD
MRTGSKNRNGSKPRFSKVVGDPRDARGLFAAMRRYIEHRGVLGATESSLFNLERYLRDFIEWADARNVTHPEHVTMAVLERYQRWLYYYRKQDGAPLSIASQRGKVMPLKSLFKWLTRTGQLPANPAAELELPKAIRALPRQVMSLAEVETVLASVDTGTALGLRDRAIMEVLYATGMRRMELAGLQIGDIDHDKAVVFIRQGKGCKDRLIPLGERALHWVQQYQDRSRPEIVWNKADLTLFLGREGLPLSLLYLSSHISGYIKKAEIGKKGSCHLFRHTMATLMLENGADIRFIQAMLGHEKLDTTQIYTHLAITQLMKVHATTHPGASRRAKGAQSDLQAGAETAPAPVDQNAVAALFAALEEEAIEESTS